MSSTSFGLYVGNTTTSLAVWRNGRGCEVVANPSGDRVTPSAVCWHQGGEVGVGLSAKQHAQRFPKSAVTQGHKSALGRKCQEQVVSALASQSGGSITAKMLVDGDEPQYQVEIEGAASRCVAPKEVHYHILKYMRDLALMHASADEDLRAVLTVPWDFSPEQRQLVQLCAEKAGFAVQQIVSEPAAAALAYQLGQLDTEESVTALIYRSGGFSTACTAVIVNGGFVTVLGHVIQPMVGGHQVTEAMTRFLALEFKRKYQMDPREGKRSVQKLRAHGENVKHILSTLETANCNIESLHEGMDFNSRVARARFDNELTDLIPGFLAPIHEVLKQSGLGLEWAQKLILCGGNAKVPKLQKAIKALLPESQILSHINCDEVFAYGAAIQSSLGDENSCASLNQNKYHLKALNADIQYRVNDKEAEDVLIPKGCPIPVKKSALVDPGTRAQLQIELYSTISGKEIPLAKLKLDEITEESRVTLSAHFYRDGGLHVTLTDNLRGHSDQLHIPPAS